MYIISRYFEKLYALIFIPSSPDAIFDFYFPKFNSRQYCYYIILINY